MTEKFIARTPKNDLRDKIQVEIGDSKDDLMFYPQVKIMRWGNEVNFSARLVHDEKSPIVSTADEIIWVGDKIGAKFYDLAVGDDGGIEFEVILKEKPTSNKIQFTLQTKGLVFHYQPPLTDEIKIGDEGGRVAAVTETDAYDKAGRWLIHRPENVVGSYAVYMAEPGANIVGGKLYRTGQVGMIYRPRITDAAGNWAWEGLNIENDILTITIPQDFLDTAVYPVRSTGVNFGYETAGGTASAHYDDQRFCWATPASGGTGDSMTMYARCDTSDNPATGVLGLYVHADGTLVSNSQTTRRTYNSTTAAWITDNFGATKPIIVSGTKYWLSSYGGENATAYIYMYWNASDAGKGGTIDPQAYSGTENLPASVTPTAQSRIYSIYATYTVVQTLAIANAAQAQAIGNVALTVAKTLAIANTSQAQAAGNVVLVVAKTLAIANVLQAQSAESPALVIAKTIIISSIGQSQTIENVALVQDFAIAVQNIAQGQAADNPVLVVNKTLAPQDIAQPQAAGNVTLIENIPLVIQNALTGQAADDVVLEVAKTLAIDAIAQAQSAEAPALVINFTLAIQSVSQSQTAENVTLIQDYLLSIQAIAQPQSADNVTLETAGGLVIDNTLQAQTVENVVLVQDYLLKIQNALTGQSVGNVILTVNKTLSVQDALAGQGAENVGLAVAKTLAIDNLLQAQAVENVTLVQNTALIIGDALQSQSAETPALAQDYVLAPQNALQAQAAENVILSTGGITLTIQNAGQAQAVANVVLILAIVKAWTLRSRSTAWTLESRSPAWTLKDRAQAWTLDTRTNTWTLSDRSTAWTLKEDDR